MIRYHTDDQVRNAAKLSMLDDFIDSLPSGYDTPVGERGITLSGGQKTEDGYCQDNNQESTDYYI